GSGYATLSQTLGDGAFGAADVDLYAVYAAGPAALFVATSPPTPGLDTDTMVRVFNSSLVQLFINDDGGQGLYSLAHVMVPGDGVYYIGVSGYNNSTYDPAPGGSGVDGETGDYRLDVYLMDLGAAPGGLGGGQGAVPVLEKLAAR